MAFVHPSAMDLSYLQARESGCARRQRASSALLPGLAPARRDITSELQQAGVVAATSATSLRVFMRVRPEQAGDFPDSDEKEKVLEMLSNVHLLMHAPKSSATYKNGINGNGKLTHRYTFTHLFRPETSQQQLFNQTTLNHINEFINGHSCLIFTYGATNSGKTFTVQGTPQDPGLLPRALDVLFNSVGGQLYSRLDIQPRAFSDVCRVTAADEQAVVRLKRDTLRLGCQEPPELATEHGSEHNLSTSPLQHSHDTIAASLESLSELKSPEIETRNRETASVNMENQPHTRFSVWVSFLEIYNEVVYDLLEKLPTTKRRRTAMNMGLDRKGVTYVKGLREVQVSSANEACQVLRAGRQNLRFASNRLNHNSSRSHCVFTVKLIRMLDADNPSVARISMLSVCDLAGSERVEKTLAQGMRMKEAGNINTSLMVLGRCMKAMKQNQKGNMTGNVVMVPYRDSKLTRILQTYLSGAGASHVTMIVNLSPSPLVFDESIQVLRFSALAKQVSIQQADKRRAPTRFSIMVRRSVQTAAAAVGAAIGRPRPLLDVTDTRGGADDQYQNLLDLVEKLRSELVEARRENATLETTVRRELCDEFAQHMVQIEKDWQGRMQEAERYMESCAEMQMNEVAKGLKVKYSHKRRRTGESGDEDEDDDGETDEQTEAQERAAAAEQRCQLLEQQLDAEAADRRLMAQKADSQQEDMSRLTVQLAEVHRVAGQLQTDLDDTKTRCLRHLESKAGDPLVAQLTQQVAKLQEDLRFRDMDLREAREYLQEGGDEFLQLESAQERLQKQVAELEACLANKEEALRDQLTHQQDLEELLAGRSQRIAQLEDELERRSERCTCSQRVSTLSAQAAIPEEADQSNPCEMSFGSRMRSLRSKTGAVLRQVVSPAVNSLQQQQQKQIDTLQGQVADLTQATAVLERRNLELEEQIGAGGEMLRQQRELEVERDLAAGENERLLATNQQLSSQLLSQDRVMTDLSKRYLAATTPTRSPAVKCSAPVDLNDTHGFEEVERQLLQEHSSQLTSAGQLTTGDNAGAGADAAAADSSALPEARMETRRLVAELQTATERLAVQSGTLDELRATNERLEEATGAQLTELQTTNERLEREVAQLTELRTTNERLAGEVTQLTELQTTNERLAGEVTQLTKLRTTNERLEREVAQLTELRETKERLEREVAQLTELQTTNERLEREVTQLTELRTTNERLEREVAQLTELRTTNERLEREVAQLTELRTTNERLAGEVTQLTKLRETKERLEGEVAQLTELGTTNERLEGEVIQLTDMRTTKERLEGEAAELHATIERLEGEVTQLKKLRETKERLEGEAAELHATIERLEGEVGRLMEARETNRAEMASLRGDKEALIASVENITEHQKMQTRLLTAKVDEISQSDVLTQVDMVLAGRHLDHEVLVAARAELEQAHVEAGLQGAELRADGERQSTCWTEERHQAQKRLVAEQHRAAEDRRRLGEQLSTLKTERDLLMERSDRLAQTVVELEAERDRLYAEAADPRLAELPAEIEKLQRNYKQTLLERNEAQADTAVLQRELRELRARLESAPADNSLLEKLRRRETEVEVLQARVTAFAREDEAFSILRAELDAKKEELKQCNVAELRVQLERLDADGRYARDELEKRSNQTLKLNIQVDTLKRQVAEKDEDIQKVRDERSRLMSMSETSIRRKNEELNRERHESVHLRDMLSRLTPKSSSTLRAELDTAKADCRRKEQRIGELEARLLSCRDVSQCVPTPCSEAGRTLVDHVTVEVASATDDEVATPFVLKTRSRSGRKITRPTGRSAAASATTTTDDDVDSVQQDMPLDPDFELLASRPRTRRTTKASSVHFVDENDDPGTTSECSRSRPPLDAITESQAITPQDQAPPQRAKSTGTKRKLFKRCSDVIMQFSPVKVAEKHVSPRKVVTRSLRSRKK